MAEATATGGGAWEHFAHGADIGVRGCGATKAAAFAQAALALAAVVADLDAIEPRQCIEIACEAPDDEILLVDWLNALVFEMATRGMMFGRFEVRIDGFRLRGKAWGEPADPARHGLGTEVKARPTPRSGSAGARTAPGPRSASSTCRRKNRTKWGLGQPWTRRV